MNHSIHPFLHLKPSILLVFFILDYALEFVTACPEAFREELKVQENQALWRSRRSTATVRSKSEVERLIL